MERPFLEQDEKAWHDMREVNRTDKRRRIQLIAAALFVERGFDAVSVRDLADAAEITQQTLYRHIGSKHQLLAELHRSVHEDRLARFRRVQESDLPARAKLTSLLREGFELAALRRDEVLLVRREAHRLEEPYRTSRLAGMRELEDTVIAILNCGVAEGAWSKADVWMGRMIVRGILNDLPSWYDTGGATTHQVLADRFANFVLKSLEAPAETLPTKRSTAKALAR